MPQMTADRAIVMVMASVLFALLAIVWTVLVSPTLRPRFVDEAGVPPATARPMARTTCEQVFADQLLGTWQPNAIPSPGMEQLAAVLDACTANELLAADERFTFIIGEPMAYLSSRRLFNGPAVGEQFARLCAAQAFADSTACRTRTP